MDKFLFRVVGIDLDYDLKRYPEGSTIELTDAAAYERRRWLEFVGPVESDEPPPAPIVPPLSEPPTAQVSTSAAFVSGPTGAEASSVQQPPAATTTSAEPAPKARAATATKKDKGASK